MACRGRGEGIQGGLRNLHTHDSNICKASSALPLFLSHERDDNSHHGIEFLLRCPRLDSTLSVAVDMLPTMSGVDV